MSRPYATKGVVELERLAAADATDAEVIADIIAELQHRNVPRARKLLARLEGEATPRRGASKKAPSKSTAKGVRATPIASGPMVEAAPAVTVPDLDRSMKQTFELLRATFTKDAEILARWGVTPSLPSEIRKSVFAQWRKLLKDGPDDLGRSVELLDEDTAKLAGNDRSEF